MTGRFSDTGKLKVCKIKYRTKLRLKNMSDIELSYAITVHKAQGCEFDRVTIVLGFMNSQLSSRKLLYTAVTRGKNKVTIIDSGERLSKMLKSDVKASRNTSLKDFLAIVQGRHKDGDS